jgi:hypothetical protein
VKTHIRACRSGQYRITSIPLATYPSAITAITPLIDGGRIEEAKAGLRAALNTLGVTTEAMPLQHLGEARNQLQLAESPW